MREKKNLKGVEVIDIFCGIGGLTHGLKKSGLNVSKGLDNELFFKYGYEKNNNSKFIYKDVRNVNKKELFNKKTKVKILVGCAPCQPFSLYTTKYKYNKNNNKKWNLLNEFLRLIKESKPKIISLENVPNLKNQEIFTNFVIELENLGYYVSYSIVNCLAYGIPQSRKRLVLLGSKFKEINLISPTHKKPKTIKEIFEKNNLEKIKAGTYNKKDFLHTSAGLSSLNIKRIRASKPGKSWLNWDENLKLACHKKLTGKSFTGVYGRMEWDKPSPTLTTKFFSYGTGRYGHPKEDRAISVREGALLQTFPMNYKFCEQKNFSVAKVSRSIGNAVPVRLGEIIGKSMIKHLGNLR